MELARLGLNLVLVGRDLTKLQDISETICTYHGVQTKTVLYDFSRATTAKGEEALARLREAVDGLEVGLLVNNAGVATPHALYLHEEADAEAWARMIRVNLCAVTEVTAVVLPGMLNRGRGAVVNIGSGSSEAIPSYPLYSVYAATKRYVAHFSWSLHVEYKAKGIDVQCQVPLFMETKMTTGMVTRAGLLSRLVVRTSAMYAGEAVALDRSGTAVQSTCPTFATGCSGASIISCRTTSSACTVSAKTSGSGLSSSSSGN
uniref:Uncharacterized protein n=1 Tax=Avena sativa TaxID=4498 RepID=A0ACD5UVF4_AVESA